MTTTERDLGQLPGQRGVRYFWAWAGVWLVYMVSPVRDAWQHPHLWQRIIGITAALGFAAVYLFSFFVLRSELRRTGQRFRPLVSSAVLVTLLVLACVLLLSVGESALGVFVYVAVSRSSRCQRRRPGRSWSRWRSPRSR
jgi:two-component system, NarL family, sensor histidine kinase DesK